MKRSLKKILIGALSLVMAIPLTISVCLMASANEQTTPVSYGSVRSADLQLPTEYASMDFENQEDVDKWKYEDKTEDRSDRIVKEMDTTYYHSGSASAHFYKDSLLETSWLENREQTYTMNGDATVSYEVSAWVKTANSSPSAVLSVAMRSFKADGKTIVTDTGMYTVMNTTSTPSEWTQLVFHTTITNSEATEFWLAFSISTGKAEFWVDDIRVREYCAPSDRVDTNGNTIYNYFPLALDFQSKDEVGRLTWDLQRSSAETSLTQKIEDNAVQGGFLSAPSGYAYITKKIYVFQTGYSYKLFGDYEANTDVDVRVELYDSRGKSVSNYSLTLSKANTSFEMELNKMESASYALLKIGFANANQSTLTLKNVGLLETATPVKASGWSGQWVWYESNPGQTSLNQSRYFRYTFNLSSDAIYAPLQISCDDEYIVWINGHNMVEILSDKNDKPYTTNHYNVVEYYMIEEFLHAGENVIAIEGSNGTSTAALVFDCKATLEDGSTAVLVSKANDSSLLVTKLDDDSTLLNTHEDVAFETTKNGEKKTYVSSTPAWAMPSYDVTYQQIGVDEEEKPVYGFMGEGDTQWHTCVWMGDPPCSPWGAIFYDMSLYSSNTMEIVSVETPKDVKSGDTIRIPMTIKMQDEITSAFDLGVSIWQRNAITSIASTTLTLVEKNTDMTQWQVGVETDIVVELKIPKYLETGEYELQLDDSYLTLSNDFIDQKFVSFNVTGSEDADETLVSSIENVNGSPAIVINGQPVSPIMYVRPEQSSSLPGAEETIVNSGIELYATRLESELEVFWKDYDVFDFTEFDAAVYDLLAVNGDAKVMLCITLWAPTWWMDLEENQGELVLQNYRDREENEDKGNSTPDKSMGVSFSSLKFRSESSDALTKLINHVKQQTYYNKLFAFQICAGATYEWMVFQSGTLDSSVDYSEASQKGFETYLRNKYKTQEALRKAWNDDTVTFANAKIPNSTERDPNGGGGAIFYDPQKDQRLIDFNLYLSDEGATTLLTYAEIVKDLTNDEKIVGAFNGYMWTQSGSDANGKIHSSFNRLLNSDDIDFFISPLAYSERYMGQASTYMPVIDSILAHGKMYIAEVDHRTSLESSYSSNQDYDGSQGISTGKTYTTYDTVLQYRRELVQCLTQGVGLWFFDMRGNWVGDEQFYQAIVDMKEEFDYSYSFTDRSVQNEVAVIVGEETYAYSTFSGFNAVYHFNNYTYRVQRTALNAMGTGYDVYSMGDLTDGVVPDDYKVYIMLSPVEVTAEESAAIDQYIKKDGHTVVWVYACGYSNGTSLDVSNISALTGITVNAVQTSSILNVRIHNDNENKWIAGLGDLKYGNSTQGVNPLIYVEDNAATALGTYCVNSTDKTGLAVKDMGNWTSIYSGAMNLPVELLRNILKASGVHIYSENSNDVVFVNNNYVSIHSGIAEQKTITLDGYYAVYDVMKGEWYSMNTNTITYMHGANETSLFRLSTPDKYRVVVTTGNGVESSVGGLVEVGAGGNVTLTLTAKEGYTLNQIFVNGEAYAAVNGTVTLNNITDNVNISVDFSKVKTATESPEYIYQYEEIDDGNILPVKIFLTVCCVGVIALVVYRSIKKSREEK